MFVTTLLTSLFSAPAFAADMDTAPEDLRAFQSKLNNSFVELRCGLTYSIGFAGNYNFTQEMKDKGQNSLILTSASGMSGCKYGTAEARMTYKGAVSFVSTYFYSSGTTSDFASVITSVNIPTLQLYSRVQPQPGWWVGIVRSVPGYGIIWESSKVRYVNPKTMTLSVDAIAPGIEDNALVFSRDGQFIGMLSTYGAQKISGQLNVQGAPLQCRFSKSNATPTVTNCGILATEVWSSNSNGSGSSDTGLSVDKETSDALNSALDSVTAAKEAIDAYDAAVEDCLSVSNGFLLDTQELYDSTDLSSNCETLEVKANLLRSKIFALNPVQVKTIDAANRMVDQANLFAEDADSLVAQTQDITDELSGTEELFASIISSLEPVNDAESEVIETWSTLIERVALLPKASQGAIQKSQVYKSSVLIVEQLSKTLTSRDSLLEKLSDLNDPRKLKIIASQFATLRVNASQLLAFERSSGNLNKVIPSKVCSKGSQTVLTSKLGTCPAGYKKVSTIR
jgi:hypothetical protein